MRALIFLNLVIWSSVSFGFDFHGVKLGEDCSNIAGLERKVGGSLVAQDKYHFGFNSPDNDKLAFVLYNCEPENKVESILWTIEFDSLDELKGWYWERLSSLKEKFGAPTIDAAQYGMTYTLASWCKNRTHYHIESVTTERGYKLHQHIFRIDHECKN